MVVSTSISDHLSWSKEPRFPKVGTFSNTMKNDEEEVTRFHGDGLSLRMDSNHRVLEITGDGCRITLAKNCGSVRVVGDGCSVKIDVNEGDIVYKGDGGRVLLGPDSSKENVKYVGDGGRICFDRDFRRTSSKNGTCFIRTISNNSSKRTKDSSRELFDPLRDRNDLCTKRTSSKEEIQNLRNEKRETRQSIRKGKNSDETKNTKETVFITTKVVTITEKDNVVKKWFVNPTSVMGSFDEDDECVKIVSNKILQNDKVEQTGEKR